MARKEGMKMNQGMKKMKKMKEYIPTTGNRKNIIFFFSTFIYEVCCVVHIWCVCVCVCIRERYVRGICIEIVRVNLLFLFFFP